MLQSMMPEENTILPRYFFQSLEHQTYNIVKVAIKMKIKNYRKACCMQKSEFQLIEALTFCLAQYD